MMYYCTSSTYKGVFFKQQDESKFNTKVMTFSGIGTNNRCIWGSRNYDENTAITFAAFDIKNKLPKNVSSKKITLAVKGNYGTTVKWSSEDTKVIDDTGAVTAPGSDKEVALTADITIGNVTKNTPVK